MVLQMHIVLRCMLSLCFTGKACVFPGPGDACNDYTHTLPEHCSAAGNRQV
jgi:hypothetical protein